jgi:hypothetical protein
MSHRPDQWSEIRVPVDEPVCIAKLLRIVDTRFGRGGFYADTNEYPTAATSACCAFNSDADDHVSARHERAAARCAPAKMSSVSPAFLGVQMTSQERVSFDAERTARYHSARRGFFEGIHRWTLFAVVASGSVGFINFVGVWMLKIGVGPEAFAGLAALIGAANLAFDPAGRARLHEALQRKAYELGAEVDGIIEPTPQQCAEWRSKLHKIFAEEPPPKRALDAVVYNATLSGRRENPDDDLIVISFSQRTFKQVLPFQNAKFPRRAEVRSRRTG